MVGRRREAPRLDDGLRERDIATNVLVGSLLEEDLRQLTDAHVETRTVALGVVPGHHLARGEARGTHDGLAGRVQRTDDARALERGVRLRHPLVDRGLLLLEPAEQRVEGGALRSRSSCSLRSVRLRGRQRRARVLELAGVRRGRSSTPRRRAAGDAHRRARCPRRCSAAPVASPPAWYSATARSRRCSRMVSRVAASAARCRSSSAMCAWSSAILRLDRVALLRGGLQLRRRLVRRRLGGFEVGPGLDHRGVGLDQALLGARARHRPGHAGPPHARRAPHARRDPGPARAPLPPSAPRPVASARA